MGSRKVSRKRILLVVVVILFAGVVASRYCNVSPNPTKGEVFTIYKSKNPALDFTFEYPALGWTPKESQGTTQKYDAVQVLGPANAKQEYSVYISVGVRLLKPEQLSADLPGLFLEEKKRFKGFKVLEEKNIKIQNYDCPSATYEYFLRLPFWKKNAKDVLIKETTVFLTKDNRSYRISCAGTAEQFKQFSYAFEKAFKTFQFTS